MTEPANADSYLNLMTPGRVRLLGATRPEEQAFCEWFASEEFRGEGCIVEFGPWLGSLTVATAIGLLRNQTVDGPSMHVYDLFRWEAGSNGWAAGTPFEVIYQTGDDFRPLYEQIVAPFRTHLDLHVHTADMSREAWDRQKIEFLVNDVWKTIPIMTHTIGEFFPHLLPGATLLQQDYLWCTDSFIHVAMYRLRDYFDCIVRVRNAQTVVFRLKKELPADLAEWFADLQDFNSFTVEEIDAAFEWSGNLFDERDPDAQLVIRAAKAWMLFKKGLVTEAQALFRQNRESPHYNHPFYSFQEQVLRFWGLGKLLGEDGPNQPGISPQ